MTAGQGRFGQARPRAASLAGSREGRRLGIACTVFGALAAVAFLWLWALSVSPVLNPPDWIRILGIAGFPVGIVGSAAAAVAARGTAAGRGWIAAGLSLAAAALAGFIILVAVLG